MSSSSSTPALRSIEIMAAVEYTYAGEVAVYMCVNFLACSQNYQKKTLFLVETPLEFSVKIVALELKF